MKFTGYTDGDDYHIQTLLWYLRRREFSIGWYWREWELSWRYVWHDGPIWQLCVGPLCITVGY